MVSGDGPDFRIHQIYKLLPVGEIAHLTLVVGRDPPDPLAPMRPSGDERAAAESAKHEEHVFGRKVSFTIDPRNEQVRESIVPIPRPGGLKMRVRALHNDDDKRLAELMGIVASIKTSRR